MDTMLAATLKDYGGPLVVERVARPKPSSGQILIKLEASGVCHSDVHVWTGSLRPPTAPALFILGHEGVGRVVTLGENVTGWRIGDRAGAAWIHSTCGTCAECLAEEESFCQTHIAQGFNVPGTFAEYVIADASFAARLPEDDAADLAPILCAGLTAYGALRRAEVQAGETVAIFGCGGLGLYAVQVAKRLGATVFAFDKDPEKVKIAIDLGAELVPAQRAHVCINFAPTVATWDSMIEMVRPRGRIISAAMVPEPVLLNQEWMLSTGVKIMGTSVGTRVQMQELMALHAETPLKSTINRIALKDVTSALKALHKGTAKGRFCIVF